MSSFTIADLDAHIKALQSQLSFLASALEESDHNTDPEWLATDLINLKGKSSMLCDDMRRVRKRMFSEGIRISGTHKVVRADNKRLSIEAPKASSEDALDGKEKVETPLTASLHPSGNGQKGQSPDKQDDYEVQYVDVTEEVNRRLRESRLRQLMESPSTAKKRKYDALETADVESGVGNDMSGESDLELLRSPTKKLKMIGNFQHGLELRGGIKRGNGTIAVDEAPRTKTREGGDGKQNVKRRKV